MKYSLSLLLALFLCGCSAVYSHKPVGESPKDLTHEVADWEGAWLSGDKTVFHIKVTDPVKGMLQVAWIEQQNNTFELKKYNVLLRDSGKACFVNCKEDGAKEAEPYVWGKISRDDRQIVLWAPNADQFKELLTGGRLPGETDKDNVTLGDLSAKDLEMLASPASASLYEWEKPLVLSKISK